MNPRDFEQVKEIFQSVRVLPHDQRIAYLNIRCSNNNHLREEIERLLSSYDTEFPDTLSGDGPRSARTARLAPDQDLGNYRILEQIGIGGMGEVYLAEDSRLRRKVALKVLPESIAANDDRLHRFEREAIAASGLNHPNILTIYEFGRHEDIYFLASEYVKGDSVRRRLHKRKLSLAEALNITQQAGAALEAAHQSGLVHRDIKPENIMIRDDGLVKVLDFGLAKYLYTVPLVESAGSDDLTRPKFSTLPGTVMGTVAYMSPEQARGKSVDARSDIWSLGVVLYEMITGRLPFDGETNSDRLASILKTEPASLSSFAPSVPNTLDNVVRKALRKDIGERYQNIGDMLLDLRMLQGEITGETRRSEVHRIARTADPAEPTEVLGPYPTEDIFQRPRLWWVVAGITIVAVAAGLAWLRWGGQTAVSIDRQISQLKSWKVEIGEDYVITPRFSPDGRFVAYVASNRGRQSIWLHQIAGGSSLALRESETFSENSPVWSPDGSELAFISTRGDVRGIFAAPALNGPVRLIAPIPAIDELVRWSRDGTKLFFVMKQNLYVLDIASREETKLTNFDESLPEDRNFAVSPSEDRLAYVENKDNVNDVWVSTIDGRNPVQLTQDAANDFGPVWHPDGKRILYSSIRNGIAQIEQVSVDGSSSPVQITSASSDILVADITSDGSKVIGVGTNDDVDVWRLDMESRKALQTTNEMGAEYWPNISPDGQAIAYQSAPALSSDRILNSAIMSRELRPNGQTSRIVSNGYLPRWSPAGGEVAFLRAENGNNSIWVATLNGEERKLSATGVQAFGYAVVPAGMMLANDYRWNANGESLVYSAVRDGLSNIWQVGRSGGETRLTNNQDANARFFEPLISTDGRRLVWVSTTFAGGAKREWRIFTSIDDSVRELYRSKPIVSILGWSPVANEVLVKAVATSDTRQYIRPSEIDILRINCETGEVRELGSLSQTYFSTVVLSVTADKLAAVEREDGADRLNVAAIPSLETTRLADGAEERVYLSNPSFSPDGKSIFYTKQSRWRVLSLIENLR